MISNNLWNGQFLIALFYLIYSVPHLRKRVVTINGSRRNNLVLITINCDYRPCIIKHIVQQMNSAQNIKWILQWIASVSIQSMKKHVFKENYNKKDITKLLRIPTHNRNNYEKYQNGFIEKELWREKKNTFCLMKHESQM